MLFGILCSDVLIFGQNTNKMKFSTPTIMKIDNCGFALVLLLFGLGGLGCGDQAQLSSQKLYDKYYQPYDQFSSFKSKDSLLENQLNSALGDYLTKNYHAAFEKFSYILAQESENQITATYYTALTLLEMPHSSPDRNILIQNLFNDLIKQDRNPFREGAIWYLALHHLKIGQTQEAVSNLEKLQSPEGRYFANAKTLLGILREKDS